MRYVIFIIAAYITGILAAVPAGPVQIEVVRRTINGHLRSSLMVILGALIADIAYGIIAFFGIAPFLEDEKMMAIFSTAGAALLIFLGIAVIRHSSADQASKKNSKFHRGKRWGLIGGFSLSAANPMMVLWWLIGVRIFKDIKLIDDFSPDIAVTFLAAGGFGLASYLLILSFFLYWAKHFISDTTIKRINLVSGVILLSIAAYFIYSSCRYFFKA
ncbi:MAG: LysE family transporter [Nitrospirae bacterium]|nr:LysE family transporter [Nitrospirota bacterium]